MFHVEHQGNRSRNKSLFKLRLWPLGYSGAPPRTPLGEGAARPLPQTPPAQGAAAPLTPAVCRYRKLRPVSTARTRLNGSNNWRRGYFSGGGIAAETTVALCCEP